MDVRLHQEMVGFSRIKYSSPSRKRGKISFPLHKQESKIARINDRVA